MCKNWHESGGVDTVVDMDGAGIDVDTWTEAFRLFKRGLGIERFQWKKEKFAHEGYTMFPQWTDPSAVGSTIASSLKSPGTFYTKCFEDLYRNVRMSFLGSRGWGRTVIVTCDLHCQ